MSLWTGAGAMQQGIARMRYLVDCTIDEVSKQIGRGDVRAAAIAAQKLLVRLEQLEDAEAHLAELRREAIVRSGP